MNGIFPLADKLRPQKLDECQGQGHLIARGKILHSFIENDRLSSLIFWGPPGTGKTTISKILVNRLHFPSVTCSATTSNVNEIRKIMKKAIEVKKIQGKPLVVFVDEIHHFNKHSQDAFLPYIERGDIILIGTTIENPAYKINRALLSRLKILEFYSLAWTDMKNILQRARQYIKSQTGETLTLSEDVEHIILDYGAGDARRLLNLLEILVHARDGDRPLDEAFVLEVIQKKTGAYDRSGDDRYQLISAYHKSVRNSDCDSALFWLYRMMEGGEDPLYIIRRMIRIAGEDIGFADPDALAVCLQTKEAYEYLGSPEGDIFLARATVYLAVAPKSNSLYLVEKKMKRIAEKYRTARIPLYLINPSDIISSRKGAGKGYQYAHDFREKTTTMRTLPEEIGESDFFVAHAIGFERKIKDRMEYWKKIKSALDKKKK